MVAIVRYHGGKVRMASRIAAEFPVHEVYIEPFGGGAAVLLAKPRSRLEIYNDLDGEMVNLFRVLRESPRELALSVEMTPFAREEFQAAYQPATDPVERARRTLVKSHMGFGSNGIHRKTGFRSAGIRAGTLPVHCWSTLPDTIVSVGTRMKGVVIEQMPATDLMRKFDADDTLFYVDPPYHPDTRDKGRDYAHEMSKEDHKDLLDLLTSVRGRVVLSGYANPDYDAALSGWRRVTFRSMADGAREREEVLWMNFNSQSLI